MVLAALLVPLQSAAPSSLIPPVLSSAVSRAPSRTQALPGGKDCYSSLRGPYHNSICSLFSPFFSLSPLQGTIRLAYRPVLPDGCAPSLSRCVAVGQGGEVRLGGYGVELALKNMEYKAIDDSSSSNSVPEGECL